MKQTWLKTILARSSVKVMLTAITFSVGLFQTQACATDLQGKADLDLVYVGMQGPQIHAMRFDASSGRLAMIGPVANVSKSLWAVADPKQPKLYAANDDSPQEGSVIAFSVDRVSGALTTVNEVSAGGKGTTHLWLDLPSKALLAANFGSGTTSSLTLNPDGSLGTLVSTMRSTGSGPHRRQTSPHAHGVAVDPSGRYALVADLGADRVFVYGFDRTTRTLTPDDTSHPRTFIAPPGSGPRHLTFTPNGRFVYLLNELSAEIMALRWDTQKGHLALIQTTSLSTPEFQGTKSGSEIAISQDGRFIYASNRGEHAIVVYRVNPNSGELSQIQRIPSGGELPWTFAIHPSGNWMLVANQRSGKVNVFSIDTISGIVTDRGHFVETPAPVSLTFVSGPQRN